MKEEGTIKMTTRSVVEYEKIGRLYIKYIRHCERVDALSEKLKGFARITNDFSEYLFREAFKEVPEGYNFPSSDDLKLLIRELHAEKLAKEQCESDLSNLGITDL